MTPPITERLPDEFRALATSSFVDSLTRSDAVDRVIRMGEQLREERAEMDMLCCIKEGE